MRVAFTDQAKHFPDYLRKFKTFNVSSIDTSCVPREINQLQVCRCAKPLSSFNFSFLFRYHIFPENILTFLGEWELEGREMREGDTIVQQAYLPPAPWGVKLIFAVRVLTLVRTESRIGFAYGTIEGHAERGTNEFTFAREGDFLTASVVTASQPGILITRLFPFLMRLYVRFSNRKARDQMQREFFKLNPGFNKEG